MNKKEKVIYILIKIKILKIIEFEPKLITGYKNRVQKFMFNMIYEPCKIADTNEKIFSFRPENNFSTKKIKLRPFITDYNRVNNYLKHKKEEQEKYPYSKKNKSSINYNRTENTYNFNPNVPINEQEMDSSSRNMENQYLYLQPVMKFAPRTEFERIYDTLNKYNYGSVDKNLIKDQLKTLGFLTVKNMKVGDCQNEYSLLKEKFKVSGPTLSYLIKEKARLEKETKTPETIELIANINDIIKINKEIIHDQEEPKIPMLKNQNHKKLNNTQKKIINNYIAKNILGEYQKKTHFKALLNTTLNLEKSNKKYKSLSNNTKTHFSTEQYNDNKSSTINTYKNFKTMINKTCFKPFHSKKNYPKEDMEYLKKLCNMAHNEYFRAKNQIDINKIQGEEGDEEPNKYLKHANTVLINGKAYNKKDLPTLTKVILKECNYIKKYYDKESAGDGKTMITRGLSVNEFTKKYRLPK